MAKRIPLTQGYYAVANSEYYDYLWTMQWCASVKPTNFYAVTSVNRKMVSMHRLLMDVWDDRIVDHFNNYGWDNRNGNLRVANDTENKRNRGLGSNNTLGYKGIKFEPRTRKYTARVFDNGAEIYLGSFATAIESALAYDDGARYYYGEFASLNFPRDTDPKPVLEEMDDNRNVIRIISGEYFPIEPQDWEYLSCRRWRLQKAWGGKWYLSRGGGARGIQPYMHREIMEYHLGRQLLSTEIVDHINHDTSDNRFSNLRLVTARQSSINLPKRSDNTSGLIGVSWSKAARKWMGKIKDRFGKQKYLGLFEDKNEAGRVRDAAAVESYGIDYATLNFPEEWGR